MARVCFQVASRFDSQVVLDDTGAQDLLGKGDMLFKRPGQGVQRVQGCMVAESEVLRVVEELKAQGAPEYVDAVTEPETALPRVKAVVPELGAVEKTTRFTMKPCRW